MYASKAIAPLLLLAFFSFSFAFAQKPPIKFGQLDSGDLPMADCAFEPGAAALVLCDFAECDFSLTSGKGLSFELRRHKRIKIFTKNGLDHANVSLVYYAGVDGHYEKIDRIRALCHYLENGVAKTVELASKDVFTADLGRHLREVKFAIPAAREGCVVEYSYVFQSHDLGNIDPWYFQESIPVAHSELRLVMPQFLYFQKVLFGKLPLQVDQSETIRCRYSGYLSGGSGASERLNYDGNCNAWNWVMQKAPSVREEPFMGAANDLAAHLEFQLQYVEWPSGRREEIMTSYAQFNQTLLDDSDFGKAASPGRFEKSLAEQIAGNIADPAAKAAAILEHLQQKIAWDGYHGLYTGRSLQKVYESGTGKVPEINLLLVACLRAAGLKADPLILSTRGNGRLHPIYPNRKKINYVVAALELDGIIVFADASIRGLPLGFLPSKCLQGDGYRVSAKAPGFVPLQENATGNQVYYLDLAFGDQGWAGKMSCKTTGYLAASDLEDLQSDGRAEFLKSEMAVFADWQQTAEPKLMLAQSPAGVTVEAALQQEAAAEDVLYFKPVFKNRFTENPLQSETRVWPLDLPYAINFNNVVNIAIPEGYAATEVPENAVIVFGDNRDLTYQYRCTVEPNRLMIISKLQMNRVYFLPEEYPDLRQMFDMIAKKHQEMVVFQKK